MMYDKRWQRIADSSKIFKLFSLLHFLVLNATIRLKYFLLQMTLISLGVCLALWDRYWLNRLFWKWRFFLYHYLLWSTASAQRSAHVSLPACSWNHRNRLDYITILCNLTSFFVEKGIEYQRDRNFTSPQYRTSFLKHPYVCITSTAILLQLTNAPWQIRHVLIPTTWPIRGTKRKHPTKSAHCAIPADGSTSSPRGYKSAQAHPSLPATPSRWVHIVQRSQNTPIIHIDSRQLPYISII